MMEAVGWPVRREKGVNGKCSLVQFSPIIMRATVWCLLFTFILWQLADNGVAETWLIVAGDVAGRIEVWPDSAFFSVSITHLATN
jgi:hypothetical protein